MNENTTFANSRPRSVKPKKRTGFTMMEMMITLAIMAVLFGLAVPAVAVIQKNLEIARLNSYAKDVYLAAQNRLTSLKATGELVELRDVLRKDYAFDGAARGRYYGPSDEDDPAGSSFKPQDWDTDWDKDENGVSSVYSRKYYDFFGIMHNPTDPADNDPVVTEIIPELSVTSTSLDHHYYIEFNPNTGDVYAAFYTDAKSGFTVEDIRKLPDGDDHGNNSGRAKAYRRDDFVNSAGENVMLGYYRGDPTDMLKNKVIDKYEVTCELVNKEDLYVKVTCDLGDTYWMRKFIDAGITLTNMKTGASIEIPINLNAADSLRTYDRSAFVTNKFMMFGYDATETSKFVAYVLLDALDDADILNGSAYDTIIDGVLDTYKDANAGKDLAGFAAAFKEGCTLQASANVELNFGDRIVRTDEANNTDEHLQNSRFAAVSDDGKSVDVGYVRHLKNLDGYEAPGNEFTINQTCVEYVVQTVFNEETGEYETQTVQSTKGDIYFDSHYTLEGGDTKWFWDSTYLVGEPTGNALRNYLNAPGLDNQAYMTPINFRTAGNNKPVTYNGKYNGLYNFVIAGADSNGNSGLFGALKKATVKDANLIDATVDGGTEAVGYVGGFVGEATDCTFSNVGVRLTDRDPVQNKHYADMGTRVNTLKVFANGATSIGGLAGSATDSTFEYSYAAVQVEDTSSANVNAGGLVGDTDDCTFKGCYTSEPTIGGDNVGGFVGYMDGGSAVAEQNGQEVYPLYATGDVTGVKNAGGFVGNAQNGAIIEGCNSYGRVTGGTTKGGFAGAHSANVAFTNCSYLKQTRYNTGSDYQSQDGVAVGHAYNDAFKLTNTNNNFWNVMADTDTANDNTADDSHPYTVYAHTNVFPFAMTKKAMFDGSTYTGHDEIPHYGDWPVEASIQTMLAYYEIYKNDDGSESIGLYGYTSLVGETVANNWQLNTLQTGDTYCIEDGYAIVSTDMMTNISGTIETLGGVAVNETFASASYSMGAEFKSEGATRSENIYVYKLGDLDVQGMSSEYAARMSDRNGTYFQKMVLTGKYNADEVFTNFTFFYCPVLAKSAINPTPAQADDPTLCPTAQVMEINKPEAGIIRSARQLNAMGRMNWFWDMNLNQECHVDFGQYTKSYCGENIDLSGTGQTTSNQWRNQPIGSYTTTYGEKPYTGHYDGCSYKIIDYCQYTTDAANVNGTSDSIDAGLFGVLYKGSVKNVVLYASNPGVTNAASSAWIKSDMVQGPNAGHSIAPLVGHVEYDSDAYAEMGGTDRLLKSWSISGASLGNYAVDTATGKFTLPNDKDGSSGKWGNAKGNVTPQTSKEWMIITLEGNFEGVTGATLLSTSIIDHETQTFASASATTIGKGKITFRLNAADCKLVETPAVTNPTTGEVTPASSKRKIGDDVVITLTGGELSAWTMDTTTFTAELHSNEVATPSGDNPAAYITGLSNMSTVANCAVSGYSVEYTPASQQVKGVNIGGLVGKNQGEVYNCSAVNKRLYASGSSGSAARYIGGVAGVNKEGTLADCYSGGLLMASGSQPAIVAGIVASNDKGEAEDWCKAYTQLISCYSYCSIEKNSASGTTYYGVAGGNNSASYVKHCHFYENAIKDYNEDVFNALVDKGESYTTTINGASKTMPYSLTYAKMKKLFRGGEYALSGTTGTANFDHSWPYDTTLAGQYPFPAVVLDTDGYYVHYGDWPAPNGTIYQNSAAILGVFWSDFCVDATHKTDYNYYWGDWLKEIKYQAEMGDLKEGDYIEIVVEPEFKYDAPEAAGLFQCAIHSMLEDTGKDVRDEVNDAAYEKQGVNFGNGQVYQFLFDAGGFIELKNDPQLWFAVDYHSKGGIDGSLWETVKGNYVDENGIPAGNEDPFRLKSLTVNIYRDSSSSSTTNKTTRHSTTGTSAGQTTSEEDLTHLVLLKEWTFEEAGAQNILSTDKGSMVAGTIANDLFAGNEPNGHSNKITLTNAESFRMDISSAFNNEPVLKKNECYQVEATFALGEDAVKDMSMRPYLVSGENLYYASTYTLVQKRATTGSNAGKVIWARALYTFGEEGQTIDDDAYIVWIPREATTQGVANTLNGTLYVDNVSVKKVTQGADPDATESTEATVPYDDDGKLIAFWSADHVGDISAPTYEVRAADAYRYINIGGSTQDLDTGVKWSEFLEQVEGLTESQYAVVTLQYSDDYVHAKAGDFTFTCDAYAYRQVSSTEDIVLAEISHATGDDAFNATTRTVKWVIGGPLYRSANWDFKDLNPNMSTKSYFSYRNADDLKRAGSTDGMSDNTILCHNTDEFFVSVGIYDRDPNATPMPTRATTRALSGGSVGHSWTSQDGQVFPEDNWIKPESKGTTETGETLTFAEFVAQNALDATQYLRVTVTANDASNPIKCNLPTEASLSLKAYVDGNGEAYTDENRRTVKAESINGNSVVFHVNGVLTPVTGSEKLSFGGVVKTENNGKPSSVAGVQVKVEVMNTATVARLQGDDVDTLAGETINKVITLTVDGDTFANTVTTGANVTSWFANLPGYGLTATVQSVDSARKVATILVSGTMSKTPDPSAEVTAVIPGSALTTGGTDVAASGSFYLHKKVPRAAIIGDTVRNFYVNESGSTTVDIKVYNDTLGNVAAVPATSWFTTTGSLPAGMSVQVASTTTDTVSLTFSGTPTVESSIPLKFKVPASVLTVSGTDLNAGDVTFNIISREPVADPIFSLPAGTYKGTRTVAITCSTADAKIEYKLDDDTDWQSYVIPVTLTEGTHTLKARATKDEFLDSHEVTATYVIEQDNNLLKNGYFDDNLDGWTFMRSEHAAYASVVNGVLTLTEKAYTANDLQITASLKDGVTIKPNTTYRLSFNMDASHNDLTHVVVRRGGDYKTEVDYTTSGSYTFTTTDAATNDNFFVAIVSTKSDVAVSGTFDNFELVEVGGGSDPTTPSQSQTTPSETTPSQSQTTPSETTPSASSTTEPTGERTLVAQWVTKHGISYGYFYEGNATADVYSNCAGNATVGSIAGDEMQWQAFISYLETNHLLTSDAYLEVTFQGDAANSVAFVGAQAANATLTNKILGINGLKATYADDVKLVFRSAKGLTYNSAETDSMLDAQISGVSSGWANGTGTVKVELYTGSTGGDPSETEPSETEPSVTDPTQSQPSDTPTNLIKNGTFSSGLNDWTVNGKAENWAVQNGQLTFTASSGTYAELLPALVSPLETNKTYTIAGTITSTSANDKIYFGIMKANGSAATDGSSVAMKWYNGTFKATFSIGNDTTNFIPKLYQSANAQGVSFAIDNLWLVEGDGSNIPGGDDPNPPVTETYSVTVNGGNADKTTGVKAGELVTLTPPTTAPEGKEFKGWNVTAGGVTVTNNTFTMPAANVTIEAVYEFIEYTISVSNGNANGKSTAHLGETIQLNAGAAEEGKVFSGWTVNSPAGLALADASATMTTFTMPAANVSVEATYVWIPHNIIIKTNNDAWGSAAVVGGATTGHYTEQITLSATPASGYRFVDWSVKNGLTTVGTDNKFLMPNTEVEITANFEKIVVPTHTVTITGGTVTGKTGSETIAEGENVSITASEPDTGYEFTGWTVTSPSGLVLGSTSAKVTSFTMPTSNVAITANFAKVTYNVTCGTVQNGTLSVNKATAQYGDTVTVTATPNTGYEVGEIKVNGNVITGTTFAMPAADATVTATFNPISYTITVVNDSAKGTVTAPATANYNATVTLSAVANTGWIFSGFTSTDVTISGSTFTMPNKNVTVYATYTADSSVPVASWTNTAGAAVYRDPNTGKSTVTIGSGVVGQSGETFARFVENNPSIGADQYMKVTLLNTDTTNEAFGNARRAATTLTSSGYGTGAVTAFADDEKLIFYLSGSKTGIGGDLVAEYVNSRAVPAGNKITTTVEIFNGTAPTVSTADVTADYTVTVVGGTASPSTTKANNTVTVTPTVPNGQKFTGWTVDNTDYLFAAVKDPTLTSFTMPYNNVKLTANFETAEPEPTQPPVTGNLLINGNFLVTDSGNSNFGWVFPSGMNRTETSVGSFSIKNGNSGSQGMYQDVSLTAGTQYTLSLNLNVAAGPVDIRLYNSTANTYTSVGTVATGTNGNYTCTFTPVAGDNRILLGGYQMDYTITSAVLTASGSTPVTEPSVTEPVGDTVTLTNSMQASESGYEFSNSLASGSYAKGSTLNFTIKMKVDMNGGKTNSELVAYVPIKANGADLFPTGYNAADTTLRTEEGSLGGIDMAWATGNQFWITFNYSLTLNADTTLTGKVNVKYHAPVTIEAGGGSTPTQATTQAPKYKVTLGSVTGGTISASKTTDVAEGEQITLTATPASGYTFGGWNVTGATVGDASAVSTTFTMPKGDVTVSATFNAQSAGGGNLIVNGDFTNGLNGWDVSGAKNSFVTGNVATVTCYGSLGSGLIQNITGLTAGKDYTLTFTLTCADGLGVHINDVAIGTTTAGSKNTEFSYTFTASGGSAKLEFYACNSSFDISDVTLS